MVENIEKARTTKQNASLHLGLRNLGDEFNAAGLDMKKVLKPEIDIPWTESSVKEFMFNPISIIAILWALMKGEEKKLRPYPFHKNKI